MSWLARWGLPRPRHRATEAHRLRQALGAVRAELADQRRAVVQLGETVESRDARAADLTRQLDAAEARLARVWAVLDDPTLLPQQATAQARQVLLDADPACPGCGVNPADGTVHAIPPAAEGEGGGG
jgi:hypothetical protein